MIKINENFLKMQDSYLFSTIAKKVAKYQEEHPDKKIIKLGIGDVTKPLVPKVLEQMKKAVEEEGASNTFRGYGPEQGYDFLRNAIVENDYKKRGITIDKDEIFVSDGAKCDCGNIVDLFDVDNKVAITDPVYPVYLDTNIMSGRTGKYNEETGKYEGIIYIPCTAENNFTPELPKEVPDMIYLCFPNNPTGTVISKEELAKWVKYAKENNSIILYDAAYEAFITEEGIPHTIYEIDGAKEVAIENTAQSVTNLIVNAGVWIAVFIIARILLIFIKFITALIAKLPVIKQFDKLGGILYGILEAFVILYVLLAIISFIAPMINNAEFIDALNKSFIGSMLYNNNILLKILF